MSCYFQPLSSPNLIETTSPDSIQLKSYKSLILKDKTSCPIDDFDCIYWATSYRYTNQQIACYTPKIPEQDRFSFLTGLDYYISLIFGDNKKITCSDITKCKVKFSSSFTPIINFIDSSNFYAGFPLTFRIRPNANNLDFLLDIKVFFCFNLSIRFSKFFNLKEYLIFL